MSGRLAIAFLAGAMVSAVAVRPAHAAGPPPAPSPAPAASPTIAPEWAPQPGTAAWSAAHPQATAQAQATPAATPGARERWGGIDGGSADGFSARAEATHRGDLTPGKRAYEITRDSSYLDPRSWAVMIYKGRHELDVYYKGRLYYRYHAVFGRSLDHGTKLWEGDRRTPEGVYMIVGKHPSYRWRWFLTLNYPNMVDRQRYDELLSGQVLPVRGGRPVAEGGHIGIHGTDNPALNDGDVNWTTGCISVENRDISELRRILPVGTVVIIQP
jgi:L,D-transpeptidase catalytic domain